VHNTLLELHLPGAWERVPEQVLPEGHWSEGLEEQINMKTLENTVPHGILEQDVWRAVFPRW
jgi:hypothetical protein